MYTTKIVYFEKRCVVACDGNCSKAWGISVRPRVQLSDNWDDVVFLADDELPDAPAYTGTFEGGDAKPASPEGGHNRWCVRQCERSVVVGVGEPITLPDWSQRLHNLPHRETRTFDLTLEETTDMMMRGETPDALTGTGRLVWQAVALSVRLQLRATLEPDLLQRVAVLMMKNEGRIERRFRAYAAQEVVNA